MKKLLFLPVALLAYFGVQSCNNDNAGTSDSTTTVTSGTTTTTGPRTVHTLSENETYTDLKTGKTFKVHRDSMGRFASLTGEPLEYYYSPSTHDTFFGWSGRWVNDALMYDPSSGYSINEDKWAELNGPYTEQTDMNTTTDMGADKVKTNGDETKVKYDDGSKVKTNDNETKVKGSDGSKVKTNGDETKVKSH